MSGVELFVLSVALGTDLFSVAIPIGMRRVRLKVILRAAAVFALFHIVMILTGYYVGHRLGTVVEYFGSYQTDCPAVVVQNWAGVVGSLVLIGLGLYMMKENLQGSPNYAPQKHPLQGTSLLMLAFSVSVDALAAGFSMGMMDVDLVKLSIILGVVIFGIAAVGLGLGRRAGRYFGSRSEIIGGGVLILLGIHVLSTTLAI
ncbi:MAG: manganese efflux pump MntP family protein [Veillonellales bacterium]